MLSALSLLKEPFPDIFHLGVAGPDSAPVFINWAVVADTAIRQYGKALGRSGPRERSFLAPSAELILDAEFAKVNGVSYSKFWLGDENGRACPTREEVPLKKKNPPYEKPVLEPLLVVGEGQMAPAL